jgi:phosphoglycolate phosphatase
VAPRTPKIIFDLDGTLIDVSDRHYKVYHDTVILLNGKPLDKKTYWDYKMDNMSWAFILEKSQLPSDIEDEYLDAFKQTIEKLPYLKMDKIIPGARELLESIYNKYDLYLISLRRNDKNLQEEIKYLKLNKYFKKIISGHTDKKDPGFKTDLIRKGLDDYKNAVIVGDTEVDVISGNTLGITTVAVLSGIRNKKNLDKLKPSYVIDSASELSKVLPELFKD